MGLWDDIKSLFEGRRAITDILKEFKPGSAPSEGGDWPSDIVFGPTFGPPGAVFDAGGKIRYGMNSSGNVPSYDSAVEAVLAAIRNMQEGFSGDLSDRSPGDILICGDSVTTDGSGNFAATDITAATPGADEKIRVLGICIIGPEDADGTITITCGASTMALGAAMGGGNRTSGPWCPCNFLGAKNAEVQWAGAGLAAADGYAIMISYRVEDWS